MSLLGCVLFVLAIVSRVHGGSDTCEVGDGRCENEVNLGRHYSSLPYPPRQVDSPFGGLGTQLPLIKSLLYGGKKDWTKPVRFLVAGGGTGDATLHLAAQLKCISAQNFEVVHLDLSPTSVDMTRQRAEHNQLKVTLLQMSLLDLDPKIHGMFDYITSTGVLHHLSSPEAGLKALKSVLKPDGAIEIMVYGTLGRTGIYDVQQMIRTILPHGFFPEHTELEVGRALFDALPMSTRAKAVPNVMAMLGIELQTDAGLYDIFLHSQDVSYTVPELYEFAASADMKLVQFFSPGMYDPIIYLSEDADPNVLERVASLPYAQRAAMSELISGGQPRHTFLVKHLDAVHEVLEVTKDTIPCRLRDYNDFEVEYNDDKPGRCYLVKDFSWYHSGPGDPKYARYEASDAAMRSGLGDGDCKSTFEEYYLRSGLETSMTLEEYLKEATQIMHAFTDWGSDQVILSTPENMYEVCPEGRRN